MFYADGTHWVRVTHGVVSPAVHDVQIWAPIGAGVLGGVAFVVLVAMMVQRRRRGGW